MSDGYIAAKVMRVHEGNHDFFPSKGTPSSAGFDLMASIEKPIRIAPDETVLIPTGYRWVIDPGWAGLVCPRSGLAARHSLTVLNSPGIIDPDYRGEVTVIIHNHGFRVYVVNPGDRIAQMLLVPYAIGRLKLVDSVDSTSRGSGGFGSTGV